MWNVFETSSFLATVGARRAAKKKRGVVDFDGSETSETVVGRWYSVEKRHFTHIERERERAKQQLTKMQKDKLDYDSRWTTTKHGAESLK